MALVKSLVRGTGVARPIQSEVDATWVVAQDDRYGVVLKISTYGSDSRASSPKPSQVIEVNADVAHDLIDLLTETFGSRRR